MKFFKYIQIASLSLVSAVLIANPLQVLAADAPINTGAKVTFTFDDGLASSYTQAAPTLAKYGFTGVNYVTTDCIGKTTVPNTCKADEDAPYMSWDQVKALQNTYGWEIGSHTVSHPLLASSDPDFQPRKLTSSQVITELTKSKNTLAAQGINATSFASPYGDYNQSVLAQVSKLYSSHRGFADTGYNASPYNDYIIRDQQVQAGVSVSTVKNYVDQAIASNQWLVLTFHDIQPNASTDPDDYEYNTADLDQIAAYVKNKNVPVVNTNKGLINGTNLLPNSTFDGGLTNGWTTDAPTYIKKDTANNGNYPSATNSISLTSTNKNIHLFSPKIDINPSQSYIVKNFINVTAVSSNAIGYYIDEYDANGNWVSGQFKQNVNFRWPQTLGFEYTPTSPSVSKARVQVIVPASSGIKAFIDNFQWISKSGTVTTPPTQSNLVANGTFDAGISNGWSTNDPLNIIADSGNNGSAANPTNSIRMTSSAMDRHLFSPLVVVDSLKSYNLGTYVDIKQISAGEIGFYIDEYDAAGNWISGKYVTGARVIGTNSIVFNYTPTSANVKSASLQIILTGNSNIIAYVDNVTWIRNP